MPVEEQKGKKRQRDQHLLPAKIHPVTHQSMDSVPPHININLARMQSLCGVELHHELKGSQCAHNARLHKQTLIKKFQVPGTDHQIDGHQENAEEDELSHHESPHRRILRPKNRNDGKEAKKSQG